MEIARKHIKLYIFGELSIWNCRIRCLKYVLLYYKKVKKNMWKFNLRNMVFFFNKNIIIFNFLRCFWCHLFTKIWENLGRYLINSNPRSFSKKAFYSKRFCDFRRFSLDGTFCRRITTKVTLTCEMKRQKQVSIPDSESAGQGGPFTLFFD